MNRTDPTPLEVALTKVLVATLAAPHYRSFVREMTLRGDEAVLDVGSGSGALASVLASRLHSGNVTCLDVSPVWLAVARRALARRSNVTYVVADVVGAHLSPAVYDAVTLHFVLHELTEGARRKALANLAQTLKPSGRLYLREPGQHGVPPAEIARLMAAAGFVPTRVATGWLPLFGQTFTGVYAVGDQS